jgi:hypothetical protein
VAPPEADVGRRRALAGCRLPGKCRTGVLSRVTRLAGQQDDRPLRPVGPAVVHVRPARAGLRRSLLWCVGRANPEHAAAD